MLIIGIILIIISILLVIYSVHNLKQAKLQKDFVHIYNEEIDKQNQELKEKNKELINEYQKINNSISILKDERLVEDENYRDIKSQVYVATKELVDAKNHLNDIQNNISKTIDNQKEMSQKAFENYCEVLEKQYDEYEEEYKMYKDALETSYSNLQLKLMRETDEIREELDKIKASRAAAVQALTREKEIEENSTFYCLQIPESELRDVAVLESIKPKLAKPRVLSMLIWTTFFQKPMTALCNNVVGVYIKSGIYKITNLKTKECYIGQAVDIASRWKQHAKCMLDIDTPAGNKLYKAAQEYGIYNFSWEVLEECPREQLNEKEQYYIDLYDSYNYGYNGTRGNK